MDTDKESALDEIREIVRRHGLEASDLEQVFQDEDERESTRASLLSRILAVLGGIFVFAGVAVFVALNWESMNSVERVVITLGSGLVAFVLALVADADARYRRASPTLFVIAALLEPSGLLVAIDEFRAGSDWHTAGVAVSGLMALQLGLVFWKTRLPVLLFLMIFFVLWFFGVVFDWLNVDAQLIAITLGASTAAFCVGIDRTRFTRITPFWYFVGSVTFFSGLYDLVDGTLIELAFLGVAAGGVFLSAIVRSRVLLVVSTIAMLAYIAEFTAEHFSESLGWPIVLVLIGLSLIVLSGLAMRVNKHFISGDASSRSATEH